MGEHEDLEIQEYLESLRPELRAEVAYISYQAIARVRTREEEERFENNRPINEQDVEWIKKVVNAPDVNIFLRLI